MTDISKEAVERHIERIGPVQGPREGYHPSLNHDTVGMLRALSARVRELEKENWRLKREVSHQKMVDKCGDAIGGFDLEALKGDTQ